MSPIKSIQQLKCEAAFMDRQPKKLQKGIFPECWPIFGCFSGTPPEFQRRFATTDATIYFKVMHINIFMKKLLADSLSIWSLSLKPDIMIKTLGDSKIVSF